MLKEFGEKDVFENLVSKGVSIVDFNATWCGPCKMLKPVLEEVSNELTDYQFIGIDVDEFGELAARFNVRAVPTLVVIKDGEIKKITAGYLDKLSLKHFIESSLN